MVCPTLGKARYATAEAAHAKATWAQRPYYCRCGLWHLATKSSLKKGARNPMVSGRPGRRIYYQPTTRWKA